MSSTVEGRTARTPTVFGVCPGSADARQPSDVEPDLHTAAGRSAGRCPRRRPGRARRGRRPHHGGIGRRLGRLHRPADDRRRDLALPGQAVAEPRLLQRAFVEGANTAHAVMRAESRRRARAWARRYRIAAHTAHLRGPAPRRHPPVAEPLDPTTRRWASSRCQPVVSRAGRSPRSDPAGGGRQRYARCRCRPTPARRRSRSRGRRRGRPRGRRARLATTRIRPRDRTTQASASPVSTVSESNRSSMRSGFRCRSATSEAYQRSIRAWPGSPTSDQSSTLRSRVAGSCGSGTSSSAQPWAANSARRPVRTASASSGSSNEEKNAPRRGGAPTPRP